jgi:hypothetical protein
MEPTQNQSLHLGQTGPIFGEELAIWNADPANEAKTVDQLLEKATSLYRVKHRSVTQKRPADSTSFVTATSPHTE